MTVAAVAVVVAFSRVRSVMAECTTDPITRVTKCLLFTPPRPAKLLKLGDGRTSSFEWVQTPFEMDAETRARSDFCARTVSDGLTTTIQYGDTPVVFLRNALTGTQVIAPHLICLFPGDPAPQPPPPPPSSAEFVEAARAVLTTQADLNPRQEIGGLTGLDTWMWCDEPGEVQVDVALRGWTAEATMDAVGFAWAVSGVADQALTAGHCGSEASPAATWMPETKGSYEIVLTSTWAGSWQLAYQGVDAGVFPLGPVDFATPPLAYAVGEYRGVLTPPGADQ
ncbi:MAG: hypothetical protein QM733_04610 [Ilumatobacteraceae bacterium]